MIADLKPYPRMKDSGVPWLGKVPEHWGMRRLKTLAKLNPSKSEIPYELGLGTKVAFLPMEQVGSDGRANFGEIRDVASVWTGFTYFRRGDVLVAKITPCFENGKGVCLDRMPTPIGFGSTEFHVLRAQPPATPQFLYRISTLPEFRRLGADAMTGAAGQQRVPEEFVAAFVVPLPPISEQSAIVRFLDHADRRIRRYIHAKKKLIALLNEQKQAIIHRAVTRGLDPNVRLKPSGVEWLGDVPEHWEVVRLGRLIRLTTGFPFKSDGFSQSEGDVRLLRGINIAPGRVRWNIVVRWPTADRQAFADFEVMPGDIVLGMDRPIVNGGMRVAYVTQDDVPALLLQRVARIRPLEGLDTKFALLLLSGKSFSDYLAPIFTGISVPHVSPEQIGAFRLALPSKREQGLIVRWVTDATAAINTAIATAHHEISLLCEYRSRLISDVVTGKVDLRQAAAKLPEEPEEQEAPEEEQAREEGDEESREETEAVPEEAEA